MNYTAARNYPNISRYSIYRVIREGNNLYTESSNPFSFKDKDCRYHSVEISESGRLDIISQIYYNDASLYWVIALANNIIDPFIVIPGTVLKIPSFNSLYQQGGPLYSD